MAELLTGTWIVFILNFSVSIWYSKTLLFTDPMTYFVFPTVFMLLMICAVYTLTMADGVHKSSLEFVDIPLGFIGNRRYYKRLKKGCKEIGIQVGIFHFIDSNYLSSFALSALNQIIGLLLSVDINT